MLLLAYLLYRYARSAKSRSYMVDITVFLLAVSLISTVFPVSQFGFFTFPFSFFSWPAYSWDLEFPVREPFEPYDIYWVTHRGISFLTIDLMSTPSWEYHDGSRIRHDLWSLEQNIIISSFFLFVNFLGALVGYCVGKKHRSSDEGWIVLWGFAGVVCVGASFIIMGVLERVGIVLFGFGIILLETILFSQLIEIFVRARVATQMVLGGIILVSADQLFDHMLMTTVGKMLVLFGAIIYFVKLTITYVRARNREK